MFDEYFFPEERYTEAASKISCKRSHIYKYLSAWADNSYVHEGHLTSHGHWLHRASAQCTIYMY